MFSLALALLVAELPHRSNGYAPALFDGKCVPSMVKMGTSVVYSAILGRDMSHPAPPLGIDR